MRYIRMAAALALLGLVWVLGPATPSANATDGDGDECGQYEDGDCPTTTVPETTTTTTSLVEESTTTTTLLPLPANCDEAAELPDQYWPHLDEDQDGTSCEDETPVTAPPAVPVPAQPQFTG